MSEDYLAQQQPTLTWNTARGVWEKAGMANLLCEHWELFSETWQTSGWMRNGQVFELPMQAHRTTASESSSQPILPTPVASEGTKAPSQQTSEVKGKTGQIWLSNVAKDLEALLPTTTTYDWKGANNSGSGTTSSVGLATKIDNLETNWGKFEPAIRRWEEMLGQPAPLPTKPDGKDGAHRLSSAFTEWMMGLPAGWITDVGLSRNDELKACGNGVVPQQAALALRVLLDGVKLEAGQGRITPDPQNR